jgi:hypothetical protein
MSEEITVRFKWTADELLAGMRWHYRTHYHRIVHVFFWGVVCLMIAAGTFTTIRFGTESGGLSVLLYGLGGVAFVRILRPWILRWQFSKRPDRNSEIEWRISNAGIRSKTNNGNADQSWAAFTKVVQTKGGFLFYPTSQIFHWLPRCGFASDSDFDRVAQLALENASQYKTAK